MLVQRPAYSSYLWKLDLCPISAILWSVPMYQVASRPRWVLSSIVVIPVLLFFAACEVSTSARISAGPTFSLTGSGRLASFRVYGPSQGRKIATPFDQKALAWLIQPAQGYFKGAPVEGLKIKYGEVPTGYAQAVPMAGTAAALGGGKVYWFFAEATGAPGTEGFLYFDGNTVTEIEVPGLCQSGFVGDVKPLKCGTQEPFTEPRDLELFVREHRVQRN